MQRHDVGLFGSTGIGFLEIQPILGCRIHTYYLYNNRKTTFFQFSLQKTPRRKIIA